MDGTIMLDACGSAFHAGFALRTLQECFRIRAHVVQQRLLAMQGMPKHQIMVDDSLAQDTIVFADVESGREIGRVINLYVPS